MLLDASILSFCNWYLFLVVPTAYSTGLLSFASSSHVYRNLTVNNWRLDDEIFY
jgi:hypothetical protein